MAMHIKQDLCGRISFFPKQRSRYTDIIMNVLGKCKNKSILIWGCHLCQLTFISIALRCFDKKTATLNHKEPIRKHLSNTTPSIGNVTMC